MLSRLRAGWRRARSAPLLRTLLSGVDRLWWARTIRRADIVDLDFVAVQTGRRLSVRSAVRRYVRGGHRRGMSLNPLYLERTVSRQLPDADRVPALYAYLVNDAARLQVSPLWDAPELAARHPESLDDPAGPLGFAWRRARRDGWVMLGGGVRVPWREVMRAVAAAPVAGGPRRSERPLLVCVLGPDETDPDEALALARAAAQAELDVDLALSGGPFDETAHGMLLPLVDARVSVRAVPPADADEPDAAPRSAPTAFRGPGARLRMPQLLQLLAAAAEAPTDALWLAPDGTIAAAGAVWHGGRSVPLLAGHPAEDARRAGATIAVPLLRSPARAWPAGSSPAGSGQVLTGVTVPGTDRPGAADTDVDALLRPAGLAVAGWRDGAPTMKRVIAPGASTIPRRWAIKTAAPAGDRGEAWGDTHFARGIAAALQRRGEEAVVDAYPARARATGYLDDVVLVLRGPERIEPPAAGRRLLWIISHPDEITGAEIADFDVVFAASTPWARRASERFGRPVRPLLQCTDSHRFHPTGAERTDEIVFVGTARGIARPVVVEPVRAGIPVRVYGPDWRGYIPAAAIAATGVANERLPAVYERAAVVLNDHWPAMKREGFVSNRLYDVVAAGGRAISDEVEGIADLFHGAVRTFSSPEELISLLRSDLDGLFPDDEQLALISARVRSEDSFDARARALCAAAADEQAY